MQRTFHVRGGGGASGVCGCVPNCSGQACGASDHCGGVCQTGSCGSGQHCVTACARATRRRAAAAARGRHASRAAPTVRAGWAVPCAPSGLTRTICGTSSCVTCGGNGQACAARQALCFPADARGWGRERHVRGRTSNRSGQACGASDGCGGTRRGGILSRGQEVHVEHVCGNGAAAGLVRGPQRDHHAHQQDLFSTLGTPGRGTAPGGRSRTSLDPASGPTRHCDARQHGGALRGLPNVSTSATPTPGTARGGCRRTSPDPARARARRWRRSAARWCSSGAKTPAVPSTTRGRGMARSGRRSPSPAPIRFSPRPWRRSAVPQRCSGLRRIARRFVHDRHLDLERHELDEANRNGPGWALECVDGDAWRQGRALRGLQHYRRHG